MIGAYPKHGPALQGLGYPVTPLKGKVPVLKEWQQRPAAALDFNQFDKHNIGVICGGISRIIAVDIDVYNANIVKILAGKVVDDLGFAPQRIGQPPKTLFVFRCTESVKKRKTAVFHIGGRDCAVEVLGDGQQFVASGIHPDTNKKYQWVDDTLLDVTVGNLTEVTPGQLDDFIAEANTILAMHGERRGREHSNGSSSQQDWFATQELQGKLDEIDVAVAHIPNDDWHYDDWVRLAHCIKSAVGEGGYDLWHKWSKRSKKYDETETDRLWQSIGDVHKVGAGSIFYMAAEHGFNIGEFRREIKSVRHAPPESSIPRREADVAGELDKGVLTASDIHGPVPRREWALDQWFPTKSVGVLFGQGGVGKTLLAQQIANCVAAGEPFMGVDVRQMPVLAVLCEDDTTEISRRQLDINEWLGVNEITGSAPQNCHFWPRVGEDNIICTFPSQGSAETQPFFAELCDQISAVKALHGADDVLVILDNATDFFGGNENARREVNTFVKSFLGSICQRLNATVILLAHPSLSGLASGTGMSGSTAWENSVRSRCYMTRDDAVGDLRILSRKKSNYSDISDEHDIQMIWEAGALRLPTSPNAIDRIERRALKKLILSDIEKAWRDGAPLKSMQSHGRKAHIVIQKNHPEYKIKQVFGAIQDLINEGFIAKIERKGYQVLEMPRWA